MPTKTLSIRLSVEEAQQAVAWLEKYGDTSQEVAAKIRAAMAPDAGVTKQAAEQIRALYLPAEAAAQKFERARENITKAQAAVIAFLRWMNLSRRKTLPACMQSAP